MGDRKGRAELARLKDSRKSSVGSADGHIGSKSHEQVSDNERTLESGLGSVPLDQGTVSPVPEIPAEPSSTGRKDQTVASDGDPNYMTTRSQSYLRNEDEPEPSLKDIINLISINHAQTTAALGKIDGRMDELEHSLNFMHGKVTENEGDIKQLQVENRVLNDEVVPIDDP